MRWIKRPKAITDRHLDVSDHGRKFFVNAYYYLIFAIATYNIPTYIKSLTIFGVSFDQKSISVVVIFLILFSIFNYLLCAFLVFADFIYYPPDKVDISIKRHAAYLAFRKMAFVQRKRQYGWDKWKYWKRFYYRLYLFGFVTPLLLFAFGPLIAYIFFSPLIFKFFLDQP